MSDLDTWWREVGNAALLGTARRPVPPLPDFGPAGVRARPEGSPREESLLDAAAPHRVEWHWVKGHAGHPENDRADALACAAAEARR